jgi:hypothetical protein
VTTSLIPDDLHTRLSDAHTHPDVQLAAIRQWLNQLDPAAWVAWICDQAAAHDRLAAQLGDNAVEHPNGFDLINLAGALPRLDQLPPYRVRLHIWWPERRDVIEDVHNHAWNFASCVVTGALRFITYAPTSDPQAQWFYWYPYRFGSDGVYTPEHVEQTRLRPAFDAALATGTRYHFDYRELHRVIPLDDQPTATLVVTGRFLRDGSDIYTEQPRHATGARIPRQPLGATAVRERLARLKAAMQQSVLTSQA